MSDRDELIRVLSAIEYPNDDAAEFPLIADAILARWRLVPIPPAAPPIVIPELAKALVIYTVDVWHSVTFPVSDQGDWRRYRIEAPDAVTAELVACQIAASHRGWTPVRSVVIDWEDK